MGKVNALQRLQLWLAAVLGKHYATVIEIAERTGVAFIGTFAAKATASELGDGNFRALGTAGVAGVFAGIVVITSSITTAITGNPALASLVSSTIRSRRAITTRPQHAVPLRPKSPAPPSISNTAASVASAQAVQAAPIPPSAPLVPPGTPLLVPTTPPVEVPPIKVPATKAPRKTAARKPAARKTAPTKAAK